MSKQPNEDEVWCRENITITDARNFWEDWFRNGNADALPTFTNIRQFIETNRDINRLSEPELEELGERIGHRIAELKKPRLH